MTMRSHRSRSRRRRSRFVAIFVLHAAVVHAAEAVGGGACCRAPARCCSVCSPTPSTTRAERAFANIAAEGIFCLVMPIAALVIGDSVLGAEVRAGHVPLHVAVADPDLADRARSLAGRLDRRPRHDRAGRARSPPSSPAPRRAAGPAFLAAAVGSVSYVAAVHRHRLPHPAHRGVVAGVVFLVERLLGAALTGIAQLSPTWESRAIFVGFLDDPPDTPAAAPASRKAAARSSGC